MLVVKTATEVRTHRWVDSTLSWGLVPTMGALHEGHLSLVRQARAECERVGVSIFVNPIQFNSPEDLAKYPRTPERDFSLLQAEGVDLVWAPDPQDTYPQGCQTYVTVEEMTRPLEGASRPGHFRGVTTIVAQLFNVFQPTVAYFGQKDAQQAVVIGRMVRDLAFNVDVTICPTVREVDGLAMSSRNMRLDAGQRKAATVLYGALFGAAEAWKHGEHDAGKLRELMTRFIEAEPLARIDYVSVANPDTLVEIDGRVGRALLSMAVYIDEVRLIDNIIVRDE